MQAGGRRFDPVWLHQTLIRAAFRSALRSQEICFTRSLDVEHRPMRRVLSDIVKRRSIRASRGLAAARHALSPGIPIAGFARNASCRQFCRDECFCRRSLTASPLDRSYESKLVFLISVRPRRLNVHELNSWMWRRRGPSPRWVGIDNESDQVS